MNTSPSLPKRFLALLTLIAIGITTYSFLSDSKKIAILENYQFNEGNWVLLKGYHRDSIQYAITDKTILDALKQEWILKETSSNFATTGGYVVELFNDGERKMYMDIINDGEMSRASAGILYNSDFGSLRYSNLHWLNSHQDHWKKVRAIEKEFTSKTAKSNYLDSLKRRINKEITIVSESEKGNYIYLIYEVE